MENKNHWYDGWFYDKFIAPNQDKAFAAVKSLVENNSTVLDVGTGTGRLLFQLSAKCRVVDGVDLSIRNIEKAKEKLLNNPAGNISVFHSSIEKYLSGLKIKYDYAVLSYVIHEIDESKRRDILIKLSSAAEKIILVDYLYPRPSNIWSFLNESVEFAAGYGHYSNFKNYISNGGIPGLAERSGLTIIEEIINSPSTTHIAVLKNKDRSG